MRRKLEAIFSLLDISLLATSLKFDTAKFGEKQQPIINCILLFRGVKHLQYIKILLLKCKSTKLHYLYTKFLNEENFSLLSCADILVEIPEKISKIYFCISVLRKKNFPLLQKTLFIIYKVSKCSFTTILFLLIDTSQIWHSDDLWWLKNIN